MTPYEKVIVKELKSWQKKMLASPGFFNNMARKVQLRINKVIPEKMHEVITVTIREMIRGVLYGAGLTTASPSTEPSLEARETSVEQRIDFYRKAAAVEGGATGAAGFLVGLADFPLLLGLKLKMLFDIAAAYGFNVNDYKERVYILYIFQLAFSSDYHRRNIYLKIQDWPEHQKQLPAKMDQFDWRSLQQEYRDYIDLAKMAQLIPVIGAPVGIVVNYRLMKKLGITAMNAYRMRWLAAVK